MSEQDRRLGNEAIPVDEPVDRLIERRQALDCGRQPAARNEGADKINDQIFDENEYRSLIIANRNGSTVRLGDVATVTDMQDGATENLRNFGIYNGKSAVSVQILQQPGANIIQVVDAVKELSL